MKFLYNMMRTQVLSSSCVIECRTKQGFSNENVLNYFRNPLVHDDIVASMQLNTHIEKNILSIQYYRMNILTFAQFYYSSCIKTWLSSQDGICGGSVCFARGRIKDRYVEEDHRKEWHRLLHKINNGKKSKVTFLVDVETIISLLLILINNSWIFTL